MEVIIGSAVSLGIAIALGLVGYGRLVGHVNGLGERTGSVEGEVAELRGASAAIGVIGAKLDDVRDRLGRIEYRMDRKSGG